MSFLLLSPLDATLTKRVLWLTRNPGRIISPDAHVMTRGHPAMADSTSISAVTARCVTLGRAELELINYPRTRNFCVWPPLLLQSSGKRITYPNFRAPRRNV